MVDIMNDNVLVLTPWMALDHIADWQTAISDVYQGKVDVLEVYENRTVSSPSVTFDMPAVVRLRKSPPTIRKAIKFSRLNVFTRDRFSCCYCGVKKGFKELNYDHVVPRVQGGKTVWENVVASCFPCNTKKDGRTPQQAKMPLLRQPHKPTTLPHAPPLIYNKSIPEEWKPYLQGNAVVLERTGT